MRSVKIAEDTNVTIETIQLILLKQLRRKMTKNDIIKTSLKLLTEKLDLITNPNYNKSEN